MALRSLIRPLGIARTPTRITPQLFRSSSSVAANNKTTNTDSKATTTTTAEETTKPAEDNVVKTETAENTENESSEKKKDNLEHGYAYGAYHWNMERGSAIALIPLISTQIVYGAHPVVDGLLGVVLPYHVYMGFDSCITDYIPKRKYPKLHKLAMYTLAGCTGLTMWGCYEFNTNDVGMTEFLSRLFHA